jgi:hypothetical protein
MYNVASRSVPATAVAAEKQKYYILECMFVAIGIQHAKRMTRIVICGLSGFTILLHVIS